MAGSIKVKGYTRSDGVKVKRHKRKKLEKYKGYHVVGRAPDGVRILKQKTRGSRFNRKQIHKALKKAFRSFHST